MKKFFVFVTILFLMLIFDVFVDYLLQVALVLQVVLYAAFVNYLPKPRVDFIERIVDSVQLVLEVERHQPIL